MSYFPNASIGLTGAAAPLYATLTGGYDGTDLRALLTDTSGQLKVLVENSVAVTGTFFQATQPVSIASAVTTNIQASGTALTATGSSLNVNITGGSSGNAAAGLTGSAVPASADYLGFNVSGNLVGVSATNPLPVAGVGTAGTPGTAVLTVQGISGGTVLPVSMTSTTITGTVAVTQSTSPWVVAGGGTAGTPGTAVLTVQGISGGTVLPVSMTSTTITGTVAVTQSTSPWVVSNGGTFAVQATQSGTWTVGISAAQTIAVTNAGTFATQSAITAASGSIASGALSSGSIAAGAISSGAAVSGAFASGAIVDLTNVTSALAATAPTKALSVSGLAATAYPTAVTNGQAVQLMTDKAGRAAVVLNAPRDLIGKVTGNIASATPASMISAGGANVFNDIITLILTNSTATATVVTITDNGTGGNSYSFALAANGGGSFQFPTPLPQGTSNAAWEISCSPAETVYYVAVYAINK